MQKRGYELAISTLVIFILGIAVLIGLILALQYGFGVLKKDVGETGKQIDLQSIKADCSLACSGGNAKDYCCKEFSFEEKTIKCGDDEIDISCDLNCNQVCE